MKILIAGRREGTNIGGSFERAAKRMGLEVRLLSINPAYEAPWLAQKLSWHLFSHRPPRLEAYGRFVEKECQVFGPDWLLSIGISPLNLQSLRIIGNQGARRINYLTDDPWNPGHYAKWFLKALPIYDTIFSTRQSNLRDLLQLGCKDVRYLPFAADCELFYPEPEQAIGSSKNYASDIIFAGGADKDRIHYMEALANAGFKLALYGIHWERYARTRLFARGQAEASTLRAAFAQAKIALCLVRRSNRDGHSMRTFEVPAMGACMLAEATEEHLEIFGREGSAVLYFKTVDEMVDKARFLAENEEERRRLAKSAHDLIVNGRHSYRDRLSSMLGI